MSQGKDRMIADVRYNDLRVAMSYKTVADTLGVMIKIYTDTCYADYTLVNRQHLINLMYVLIQQTADRLNGLTVLVQSCNLLIGLSGIETSFFQVNCTATLIDKDKSLVNGNFIRMINCLMDQLESINETVTMLLNDM